MFIFKSVKSVGKCTRGTKHICNVGWISPLQGREIISIFSWQEWNLTCHFWKSCKRETNFQAIRFKMHFSNTFRLKITSELTPTLCYQFGFLTCVFTIYKSLFLFTFQKSSLNSISFSNYNPISLVSPWKNFPHASNHLSSNNFENCVPFSFQFGSAQRRISMGLTTFYLLPVRAEVLLLLFWGFSDVLDAV